MDNPDKKLNRSSSHDKALKPHDESGSISNRAATDMPSASSKSAYSEKNPPSNDDDDDDDDDDDYDYDDYDYDDYDYEESETQNESGSTSIHATTNMPSGSGESTYSEESSGISTESNDSACPKVSNSLTDYEIDNILRTGDLSRMHEIDAWVAAESRADEWSEKRQNFARAFIWCCSNSDGASVHALIHLPHFHLVASDIISELYPFYLNDDPLFLEMLRDALLLHLLPEYESGLREILLEAIARHQPVSVREFYDALWSKSVSNHSNVEQTINMFYSEYLERQYKDVSIVPLIKSVIHIGISRHIRVMLDLINDPSYHDALGPYSKSKLLEWAISSNTSKSKIHVLRQIDTKNVSLVKDWLDVRHFFTSQISEHIRCRKHCESITDAIVPRIIEQIVRCAQNCRNDDKAKAISWLLSEICKAIEEKHPGATCEPLLVGSAAECTQALVIDEFDYVLFTNSKLYEFDIKSTLNTVVSNIKHMHHPRLALESINQSTHFQCYPCLYITMVDEHLRNTHFSIDLVPAEPLYKPVTLPHHNFLPVPREQRPEDGDATQRESTQGGDTDIVDHENKSSSSANNIPRLFIERRKIVFSQVENGLIKSLPSHIIEGYRLAKAFRITHVIRPIIQKLLELGVTLDIHKVIRTYHLKTCVFYLTQNYVFDNADIEGNNRWTWALAIFMKLREFVMLGDVKEFFATERYIFKGLVNVDNPECEHYEEDFSAPLPRFLCCRRRKARLLMVDQILRVLRDSKSKYGVEHGT